MVTKKEQEKILNSHLNNRRDFQRLAHNCQPIRPPQRKIGTNIQIKYQLISQILTCYRNILSKYYLCLMFSQILMNVKKHQVYAMMFVSTLLDPINACVIKLVLFYTTIKEPVLVSIF